MHPNERLIPESQLEAVVEEKVKQILAEMPTVYTHLD